MLLCLMVGGTPSSHDGGGGTPSSHGGGYPGYPPHLDLARGIPQVPAPIIQNWPGGTHHTPHHLGLDGGIPWVPPSRPGIGYPQTWDGVPPQPRPGTGNPPPRPGMGYPPPRPGIGYPPKSVYKVKTLPSVILRMRAVKIHNNIGQPGPMLITMTHYGVAFKRHGLIWRF